MIPNSKTSDKDLPKSGCRYLAVQFMPKTQKSQKHYTNPLWQHSSFDLSKSTHSETFIQPNMILVCQLDFPEQEK